MSDPINYGKQKIDDNDISAVIDVLKSSHLTQGPLVPLLEKKIATYVGSKYAVACSNGTAALHLACLALGVKQGDTVWTSAISFVASANCALYCGASIKFLDVDVTTGNISVEKLTDKIEQAKIDGKLPKVIILVHLAGNSCDMRSIHALCAPLGIRIIEDACHALGGAYENKKIGNCQYSDCCVFSFHPVKSITSGEGGAITTNANNIAERLKILSSHGITKHRDSMSLKTQPTWYYEQQLLGFNYRLSEIHAALGISQLTKIDTFINKRKAIFKRYLSAFKSTQVKLLQQTPNSESAHHLTVALIPGRQRDRVFEELKHLNIYCQLHYMPIYRQPYHDIGQQNWKLFEGSEKYFTSALSLPIYPDLSPAEQKKVIEAIKGVLYE